METEGSTFPEAVRTLAEQFGVAVDWPEQEEFHDPERDRKRHLRGQLLEAHELAAKFYHYLLKNTVQGKEAMRYLTDRGFTHKMIDTFLIGYAPPMKRPARSFSERAEIFPRVAGTRGIDPEKVRRGICGSIQGPDHVSHLRYGGQGDCFRGPGDGKCTCIPTEILEFT